MSARRPPILPSIFFNTQHAPIGAFASFTLGYRGAAGGLGLELRGPANESIFIGAECLDGRGFEALPFFGTSADAAVRYDLGVGARPPRGLVEPYPDGAITRDFRLGSDTWQARDLTFAVYAPSKPVPEPARAADDALRAALVPAVFAELTLDNRRGRRARRVFFGYEGGDQRANMRQLDSVAGRAFVGVGQGTTTAIVSDARGVFSGLGFTLDQCLRPERAEHLAMGLGGVGALMAAVPAGVKRSFRFAICFYRDGVATAGLRGRYYYTRLFRSIEEVGRYALVHHAVQKRLALAADREIARSGLSEAQRYSLAQAVRSYGGSTEMLEVNGKALWAVNEGEYRMLNTFDLTADHVFYEMSRNPWVVRNQLDLFVRRYSYTDRVRLPGEAREYPGGLSFTHDMGIGNCFSAPGRSAYEQAARRRCFSYMTHEQLVNWVCCGVTYALGGGDRSWLRRRAAVFRACLRSLERRDHPDPRQRDGVMDADSARCSGGSEITTYDSLDASLGQARGNLYLAVKTWAAYVGLRQVFTILGQPRMAHRAGAQAARCAATIVAQQRPGGYLPALLDGSVEARIIPAVEGLVFPCVWNLADVVSRKGEYAALIRALETHLSTILVPGMCRFPDGGWKLSSTNDNSWLSKIYLAQFVARAVLGLGGDGAADQAHCRWLFDPANSRHAWCDQMVAGRASGSRYYPRGVTSWLWLRERSRAPSRQRVPAGAA